MIWSKIETDTDTFSDHNPQTKLFFKFYEYKLDGLHHHFATGEIDAGRFSKEAPYFTFNTTDYKWRVDMFDIIERKKAYFIDYILGGCEIKLHFAIDFSKDNGPSSDPFLHHHGGIETNEYM